MVGRGGPTSRVRCSAVQWGADLNNNNQQQFSVHTDDGCQDGDIIVPGRGNKTIIRFGAHHIMESSASMVGRGVCMCINLSK